MDSVGKLNLFQISFKAFEIGALAVAVIGLIDVFNQVADSEIVFAVLVPYHVAAGEGCFSQIVDEYALLGCKFVEIGHFVA